MKTSNRDRIEELSEEIRDLQDPPSTHFVMRRIWHMVRSFRARGSADAARLDAYHAASRAAVDAMNASGRGLEGWGDLSSRPRLVAMRDHRLPP